MVSELKDILIHIVKNHKGPSRDNLIKIIYLADWHYAIKFGEQMTNIKWYHDTQGPFSKDIKTTIADNRQIFSIRREIDSCNFVQRTYELIDPDIKISLNEDVALSIDHIIEKTKGFDFSEFILLIYSTYPVRVTEHFVDLDLVSLAKDYSKEDNIDKKKRKGGRRKRD